MKNNFLILIAMSLTSCASIYRTINTDKIEYTNYSKINDSIEVSYNYNTQISFNNERYKKAERRIDFTAVSIKIVNNSSKEMTIDPDFFKIIDDGKPATIISSEQYCNNVRQAPESYLVYALIGPWIINNGAIIYIPFGLGIGLLNLGIAANANNEHKNNMKNLELWGKIVNSKSALTGIVFIKSFTFGDLTFNYLK